MKKRRLNLAQKQAIQFIKQRNYQAGLGMAPGVGKTIAAIRAAKFHKPVLLILRRDDFMTWRNELQAEGFSPSSWFMIDSSAIITQLRAQPHTPVRARPRPPTTAHALARTCTHAPARWTMVTYDLIKNPAVRDYLESIDWQLIIADEAQKIKRHKSKRTKQVLKFALRYPRRLALTGSPLTNSPEDLFSIGKFIDNGRTFGRDWWQFMNRWFISDPSGRGWYLRRGAKQAIAQRMRQMMYCVHEDDVLDLPPLVKIIKSSPMTPEQRRVYQRLIDDWEIEARESHEVMEFNHVIVQLQKLRQVASGFYYDPDHNPVQLNSNKLALFKTLMTDTDCPLSQARKIVVWCAYDAEIQMIARTIEANKLGDGIIFDGTKRQREQARVIFRDDPSVRFFVSQVDRGVGMNELIVAADAIYFSESYKVESKLQSMRRTRRKGSEIHKQIRYWHLVTENSIDDKVHQGIFSAYNFATNILRQLERGETIRELLM